MKVENIYKFSVVMSDKCVAEEIQSIHSRTIKSFHAPIDLRARIWYDNGKLYIIPDKKYANIIENIVSNTGVKYLLIDNKIVINFESAQDAYNFVVNIFKYIKHGV